MSRYRVGAEGLINAPAELAYALIADYRDGHPRILPRPPFVSLEVEQGGIGAGTVFRCQIRVFGRTWRFRAAVTEPDPGRVLVETDLDNETVTTFTVDPVLGGARVAIATVFQSRDGLLGRLERTCLPRLLKPVYVREIEQLGIVARAKNSR